MAVQFKTHVSQRLFSLKSAVFTVFDVFFHCFGSIEWIKGELKRC